MYDMEDQASALRASPAIAKCRCRVNRDHVRQQPGQRRVVEPGRQHILASFPHCPSQRGPALEPGPVAGRVLGGYEYYDRSCLLAVNDRQFLGQALARQIDLLVGVVKAAQTPSLQHLGDMLDIVSLRAGK
jgi:hypothetical protein